MSIKDVDLLGAEAAAKALMGLPEDDVLATEKVDGLMSVIKADMFMGCSETTHAATTEEGETAAVYSPVLPTSPPASPKSPVSPPPSPELTRVLDMAEAIRTYYVDDDDDDITASFEEMESDDAVEERTQRVEPVVWASDGDDSVFDHEIDHALHTVGKTLYPILLNSVLGSVIGREDYDRYDIRGFVISDVMSAMRTLSSSPFVEELVDEIMEMS